MLKFELVQTDKHSTSNLLHRKNFQFLRRTNHIQNRYVQFKIISRNIKIDKK